MAEADPERSVYSRSGAAGVTGRRLRAAADGALVETRSISR